MLDRRGISKVNIDKSIACGGALEIALCRAVHPRWMFFLERFLKTLKGFVRQRAHLEGSMAKGWLVHESFVYM